jgi:hypothetical protein
MAKQVRHASPELVSYPAEARWADPVSRLDALSCLQHNEAGIILKMFAAMLRCGAYQ